MQRAYAILPSVARPAVQYSSTLSHKLHDFLEIKPIEYKIGVRIFSTIFV